MDKFNDTSEKWKENLKFGAYDHAREVIDCNKIKKFSRIWRRILVYLNINALNNLNVLEIGCGGGKHLVTFALNGADCTGIDVSENVLERAKRYFLKIENNCKIKLDIKLVCNDFFKAYFPEKFDIVFNVGVAEHFLDDNERFIFHKKSFDLLSFGGYLIVIVPSGIHPMRKKMKEKNLGGYNIQEIDYSPEILKGELEKCGAAEISVLGHNIFNHILMEKSGIVRKLIYLVWQIVPLAILSKKFVYKNSDTLIAIARKK